MFGTIKGQQVTILKDDGCNTNVISKSFLNRYRNLFQTKKASFTINHSNKGSVEEANEILVDEEIQIGNHQYKTSWIVANCRYDVMLGMPWHVENNPRVDYDSGKIWVGNTELPSAREFAHVIQVQNIGVKKFRSLLKKKWKSHDALALYQIHQINNFTTACEKKTKSIRDPELEELVTAFKDVFRDDLPDGLPPAREIDHKIETDPEAKPPHRGIFQLSPAELVATKEYVTNLLQKGKIRPSKSPYGAPLFFVKQKGKLRGVIDYRALNRITKHNNAPIPRTDEMFDRLGGATYFSKLDLKSGFHQIRISSSDIEKTAFKTKYGHFEYLVMPMGLRNAPATFQALMNSIFRDCIDDFLVIYLDDILIFSNNREDHLEHLKLVLSRLRDHQLYVGNDKFELMTTETEFLGLTIGIGGVKIGEERKKLIREWPKPKTVTELRSFLGLAQFFRRFIKSFSRIATPLTNLTRKHSNMDQWNDNCNDAFDSLKTSLISSPIMRAPDWGRPFRCHTDACQLAVGGTLTQIGDDKEEHVISYFSKRLTPAEENYSANDRELLGLIYFLKRFRCYLEGSEFEVLTDNQVLKHFFSKPELSRREARWLDFLGQFGISTLTLVKGRVHVLGDAPSRAPHSGRTSSYLNNVCASTTSFSLVRSFGDGYLSDLTFGNIYRHLKGENLGDGIISRRVANMLPHFKLFGDTLLYDGLICVPQQKIKEILHLAHDNLNSGHFGYAKTLARLQMYHWRHKSQDVYEYCRGCATCQLNKDGRAKPFGEPQPLELPDRRWGSVAMDFITHLPTTKSGYDCITTFVDRFSKRIHLVASNGTDTAIDVANCFFDDIFRLHGIPDSIVSDRDPKFTSKFWSHLMNRCGIQLKMSTSRHPQTDGSTEIMNRMVENYLRCYCAFHQNNWDQLLTSAEFAYNSAEVATMKMTPFEADIGWNPKSPLDAITPTTDDTVQSVNDFKMKLRESFNSATFSHRLAQSRQAAYNSKRYTPPTYKVGDSVYLSKKLFTDSASAARPSQKLTVRRIGPFKVTDIISKNVIRIDLPENISIHPVIHVEHTARAYRQPSNISTTPEPSAQPFINEHGESVIEVSAILSHRRRGKSWQFLTQYKGVPAHEAEWKPLRDFVDDDNTITDALHRYITHNNILQHLH